MLFSPVATTFVIGTRSAHRDDDEYSGTSVYSRQIAFCKGICKSQSLFFPFDILYIYPLLFFLGGGGERKFCFYENLNAKLLVTEGSFHKNKI